MAHSEVTIPGWYWWRMHSEDDWIAPQYVDPAKHKDQMRLMGGEFLGPIYPVED